MYSETTRSIKVTVRPFYLEQHSSPAEGHWVWAYHVKIENDGSETVQLRNRHWRITDAMGRLQEVRGPGGRGATGAGAPPVARRGARCGAHAVALGRRRSRSRGPRRHPRPRRPLLRGILQRLRRGPGGAPAAHVRGNRRL